MRRRKRTNRLLQEWIEFAPVVEKGQTKTPSKYMIIAYDPDSKEDYPLFTTKKSKLTDIQIQLSKERQKVIEVITL